MAEKLKKWHFRPRYRITGHLYTKTPFFTGSGQTMPHPEIKKDDGKPAEVMAFPRAGKTPFIPGHTIKGCLRAWLAKREGNGYKTSLVKSVFGEESSGEDNNGLGGKALFLDAMLIAKRLEPTPLPIWNPATQTYIETHVCIDRITGTAAEKMLFYQETVPPGVGFKLVVTGKFDPENHEDEIALILAALDGFNDQDDPILLGADTQTAKGQMSWELSCIERIDKDDVKEWLNGPCRSGYKEIFKRLGQDELNPLLTRAGELFSNNKKSRFRAEITINFNSHFLINDPPGPKEMAEKKKAPEESDIPDMKPLYDEMGRPCLSPSSVRGALRSQAERIVRTMTQDTKSACHPDKNPCKADKAGDYEKLCPVCRIFGAPGWKSPLKITRFECIEAGEEMTQEFLAIDRFTGGGKSGAKFNVKAYYRPKFRGSIELDLDRMAKASKKDPSSALGLLGLLLRDLKEGDITFGLGSSKGYGTCKAEIDRWKDEVFRKDIKNGIEKLRKVLKEGKCAISDNDT